MVNNKTITLKFLGGSTVVELNDCDLTLTGPSATMHRRFATDVGAELFYNKLDSNVDESTLEFFGFVITNDP
jgi:hypothetical protein